MKKTIVTSVCLAATMFGLSTSNAAIEVVNIPLAVDDTYTVPSGKILIVDYVVREDNGNFGSHHLAIRVPGATFDIKFITPTGLTNVGSGPTRAINNVNLLAGTTLTPKAASTPVAPVVVIGRLVDSSDLYAKATSTLEWTDPESKVAVAAKSTSKRPVKFRLLKSEDLENWEPVDDATLVASTNNTANFELASPTGPRTFVRATAREIIQDDE